MMWARFQPAVFLCFFGAAALVGCTEREEIPAVNPFTPETLEDHLERFPITEDTPHTAPVLCNDCHTGKTFVEYTCIDCHELVERGDRAADPHGEAAMAIIHAGFVDYAFETAACIGCHVDGTADAAFNPATHLSFPILEDDKHGPNNCADCHVAADRTVLDCETCHQEQVFGQLDDRHPGIYDYEKEPPEPCTRCHSHADIPTLENGDPAGILQHSTVSYALNEVDGDGEIYHRTCVGCHIEQLPDREYPATSWVQFSCDGACHVHQQAAIDLTHTGRLNYDFLTGGCFGLGCHGPDDRP